MEEEEVDIVHAYEAGQQGSLIVVIPKAARDALGHRRGQAYRVKIDKRGRIIYEPLPTLSVSGYARRRKP